MSATKFGDAHVVVRKVALGATPYGWEIHDGCTSLVRHVCPDRFSSMETAFKAGQAWLANLVAAPKRPEPKRVAVIRGKSAVRMRPVEPDWSMDIDNDALPDDDDLPA